MRNNNMNLLKMSLSISIFLAFQICADELASKPPSQATLEYQKSIKNELPFADTTDFELAEKGLIKRPEKVEIIDDNGNVVWELGNYKFLLSENYHDSINPSLERQARLNMLYGLYKVSDRIYQVRGYDLANMTLIKGDTG